MSDTSIVRVHGRQVLDSRGRPTIEAQIELGNGVSAYASVPSGASTGKAEAVELRDGGQAWDGLGVGRAVSHVNGEISRLLMGCDVMDQTQLDALLVSADGSGNWSRLGGNAVLSVSLASARAAAVSAKRPLFKHLASLAAVEPVMPMPMVNILSGGLHANRGMDVQDFLMIPFGAASYSEALEWICRVRMKAAELCAAKGIPTLLADEGGLSPGFARSEDALDLMVAAFEQAGLEPGVQVGIALDIAASSLVQADGRYRFEREERSYGPGEMIAMQAAWAKRYPILSIEDGLGEDDWGNWPLLTRELGALQLVGDDLCATQPARIRRASECGAANAVLIKVNQNGTVSGTLDAIRTARSVGYRTVISARSGETEDDFLADLAVGVAGGQIKIGSVRGGERQAKYNRLLRIEESGLPWVGRAVMKTH